MSMNRVTPTLQMILKLQYLKIINDRVNVGEDFDKGYWEFISRLVLYAVCISPQILCEGRAWLRLAPPYTLQLRIDGSLK